MSTKKLLLILGGVGTAVLTLACGAIILLAVVFGQTHGKRISLKSGSELYYTKNVMKDDAEKMAKFLNENFLKDGYQATFQLNKEEGKFQVKVVIQPGKLQEAELPFMALGYLISMQVLENASLEVHLCDDQLKTVKVIPINRVTSDSPTTA